MYIIYIYMNVYYIYIWQMASDLLWEFLVLFSDVLFLIICCGVMEGSLEFYSIIDSLFQMVFH